MSKIQGVIFDWAGTTVDFGCFAPVNVFVEIFKQAEIEITMEEARGPMGMLKIDHIRAILELPRVAGLWEAQYGKKADDEDVHRLYGQFEPMLLKSLAEYTDPIDEVIETVDDLRAKGLKIGSTTGYTDSMMAIVVPCAKEKGYAPDFWITPDATGSCGRPYPYMIYRNMEVLKLQTPWQVVKVGDTHSDIQEAISAGVWAVGILVGSSQMGLDESTFKTLTEDEKEVVLAKTEKAFMKAGADFTIKTMGELPSLIEKINEALAIGKRPNARA